MVLAPRRGVRHDPAVPRRHLDPGDEDFPWYVFPLFGWGIILAAHAAYAFVIKAPEEIMIERELRAAQR